MEINLFGEPITDTPPRKPRDKAKAAWEAAFQRWSDKVFKDDKAEHYGKCGCGIAEMLSSRKVQNN